MSRRRNAKGLRNIDRTTFSTFIGLVVVGLLMIYAVSFSREMGSANFFDTSVGRQTLWVGISFLAFAIIFSIDWKLWETLAYPIYVGSMLLLIAVLFLGTTIKGATSWFIFGGVSFQPSEVAKFATCLAMSAYLSNYRTNLSNLSAQLVAFGIMLLPMLLILMQPDAGSAVVFASFLIVLFRAGLSPTYYIVSIFAATVLILGLVEEPLHIILGLMAVSSAILMLYFENNKRWWWLAAAAVLVIAYFAIREKAILYGIGGAAGVMGALSALQWRRKRGRIVGFLTVAVVFGAMLAFASNFAFNNILKPHQQDRLNVWLKPNKADERGSSYNLFQSKLAIGSGGLTGKGYLKGTLTKLNYVPEQSTDFIFCTIGEEQGFVGSLAIIILFLVLLIRITVIAERQRSNFSRYYAYCVAGILFIHFFINIGMTMGILPIIGIPLPFISKGGSSLLGFTVMIAVLLKLDSKRYSI